MAYNPDPPLSPPTESIVVRYDDGDYTVPYNPNDSMRDTAEHYAEGHAWLGATNDYSAALYPDEGK